MKQHPTVRCDNLHGDRARRVQLIAIRLGIRLRPVKKEEYSRTIAALLDMEEGPAAPYEGEGFEHEMMLMAHFPSPLINSFLNAFRQAKVPAVKLKCVLTENNSKWDSIYLHTELSDEAAYFDAARKEAQERMKAANITPLHELKQEEATS